MLRAMGRISSARVSGVSVTQRVSSARFMQQASSREIPRIFGARACSESREPPQQGQGSCLRNRSTRFMPASSLTLARAFSTVCTAL